MSTSKKTSMRVTSLELYRIITMLLIVAHHYVVNSGLMRHNGPITDNPSSFHSIFLLLFGAWGKTGINCFVLFSGYFMCQKNITLKKFVKLLCEIMFYRIVISSIFWITGFEKFTISGLVKVIIPIRNLGDDFFSAYLIFYLFIPFLNVLIHHLSETQHVKLLALVSFSYIFLGTFRPFFSVTMNYASWFIVLYLISSYIRLYPKKIFENTRVWRISTIICIFISSISVLVCIWLSMKLSKSLYYTFVSDSNTLLAVLTGISSFLYFKNMKIPQNKFINSVASTTFGVLCIHANSDTMRQWLWQDMLNNVGYYYSSFCLVHAIGSVIIVFTICSCIDYLRIQFIEKSFFKAFDRKIIPITNHCLKIENKIFDILHIQHD